MLKNIFFIQTILCLAATELKAQQLPIGYCGIVNVYDNAGNRIRRVYFCNNGIDPYPAKGSTVQSPSESLTAKNETLVVQDPDVVALALAQMKTKPALGFSDCLILEVARKAGHLPLGTFDRALGRLPGASKLKGG